jgi:hypothetical protein
MTEQTQQQPEPGWSNTTDTVGEALASGPDAQSAPEPPPGWSNNPPGVPSNVPESDFVFKPPGWSNSGPIATGATAGTPGTWTPPGSQPAQKFTAMDSVTAIPATAWTTGQHVVLDDGTLAHWGGSAWVSGKA